jgi:hypothetical protein
MKKIFSNADGLDRELERERQHKKDNDDVKAGSAAEEEFRLKDARRNVDAERLQRGGRRIGI